MIGPTPPSSAPSLPTSAPASSPAVLFFCPSQTLAGTIFISGATSGSYVYVGFSPAYRKARLDLKMRVGILGQQQVDSSSLMLTIFSLSWVLASLALEAKWPLSQLTVQRYNLLLPLMVLCTCGKTLNYGQALK